MCEVDYTNPSYKKNDRLQELDEKLCEVYKAYPEIEIAIALRLTGTDKIAVLGNYCLFCATEDFEEVVRENGYMTREEIAEHLRGHK